MSHDSPADRLAALPLGTRVVVRSRTAPGAAAPLTDSLGHLREVGPTACVVETRRGVVIIELTDVVAAKPVPPAPVRGQRGVSGVTDPDVYARELATESLAGDDPTGWFERLYVAAETSGAVVPWDRGVPHRLLVEWAGERDGTGLRALVVGCGLGEDAEFLARLGFTTVAFDVAETAIRQVRGRFPDSPVEYVTADLLDPPERWRDAFDLVVECRTAQSLPGTVRPAAIANTATFVAPGGTLLVLAGARADDDEPSGPPWPLTRAEVDSFATDDLRPVRVERLAEPVDQWRAEFTRAR